MNKQDTAFLQYWMKEVITSPGTLQYKLQQAQERYALDEHEVVAVHGKASVYARLNVYTSGYILRLLECLMADFPVLHKFVGDEVFNAFAKASLVWSTPTSYTLYDLGKNFIRFLEATRPVAADAETDTMLDLPVALAKLERARQEVMRAMGTEENEFPAQEINMEDILWQPQNMIVSLPESTRMIESKFPLKCFFEKVSKEEAYDLPEPQKTYIAVSRKNYRITIHELPEWQYLFLLSCRQPLNLLEAIDRTARENNIQAAELMADLYIWLPVFCDNGILMHHYASSS